MHLSDLHCCKRKSISLHAKVKILFELEKRIKENTNSIFKKKFQFFFSFFESNLIKCFVEKDIIKITDDSQKEIN